MCWFCFNSIAGNGIAVGFGGVPTFLTVHKDIKLCFQLPNLSMKYFPSHLNLQRVIERHRSLCGLLTCQEKPGMENCQPFTFHFPFLSSLNALWKHLQVFRTRCKSRTLTGTAKDVSLPACPVARHWICIFLLLPFQKVMCRNGTGFCLSQLRADLLCQKMTRENNAIFFAIFMTGF